MNDCYSGPYRATALWNEAVLLFRENMVLKEHRHRFHKHKNSFTGYEAVTLLQNVLCSNAMFNPSISREQCCRLLRQFLKANLVSPVKNCSLSHTKTTFYDSNKYLYEFTDQLVNFEPLQPISVPTVNEQKPGICKTQNGQYCNTKCDSGGVWKIAIIKRFVELLKPLDINNITDFNFINSSWVEINADPDCQVKWKTELPDWILSAIHDIIKYTSKDYCGSTYPNFEIDAFQVITDYFKTLENPLIDKRNYDLYAAVFHHLEYLNCMEVVKSPKKGFQYEKCFERVTKTKKENSNIFLPDKVLPPNHCYEAAFTSDDTTIRVVPQCSVDSVHLRKKSYSNYEGIKTASSENCIESLKDSHTFSSQQQFLHDDSFKRNRFKRNQMPLKSIDNFINNNNKCSDVKHGIVNEGFIIFSPDNKRRYEENFVPLSHKSNDSLNKNKGLLHGVKYSEKANEYNNFTYINHGLSFSLEDINLLTRDNLDYNYALESLNNLMKVTQHNQSISDDDHSFHTALSQSELELSDSESSSGNHHVYHSCETEWDPGIIELGCRVFQLLLILLPPPNRAKLKHLCLLLYKVSRNVMIPEFTLRNMLLKMEECILKPMNVESSDCLTVHNILTFIVVHNKTIFAELPSDLLSNIKNELYEQELKKITACHQASKLTLDVQKFEDSKNSLNHLLDHILLNKNISEKERKKHLKLFKDCYPDIYKNRFPNEDRPIKSRTLFSIKNLRL